MNLAPVRTMMGECYSWGHRRDVAGRLSYRLSQPGPGHH
ncbi:hypothetical protein OKW35_001151 [Paraburkholderia sp. MM5477-R1]